MVCSCIAHLSLCFEETLYRTFHMSSYQMSVHLAIRFQSRIFFLEINQSAIRIACAGLVRWWIGIKWDGHDRDRMVVWITTTYAISAYHHWCWEFKSRTERGVLHYVINFVSDLLQVGGFLRVHRFSPPIELTATI